MKNFYLTSVLIIASALTGCASLKPSEPDPYQIAKEKYSPWEPYSISTDGTIYLAEPSTKKRVAPGVYRIWTKSTDRQEIMFQRIVDCNSEESLVAQGVLFRNDYASDPIKFKENKFSKHIPGTVGYGLITYICK